MEQQERYAAGRGAREAFPNAGWDGARVRALRDHLGESQTAFAERLGTRQQTISEWERDAARPQRMARRLLHLVAESAGFYTTAPEPPAPAAADAAGDDAAAEDAAAEDAR